MYRSFTVRNFRGFRDLTVEPFDRVNLISGKNNAGKTALLEALFLHAGPNVPGLTLAVSNMRGVQQFALDAEDIWGWMFFGRHTGKVIELASHDEFANRRASRMRLITPDVASLSHPAKDASGPDQASGSLDAAVGPKELRIEYEDSRGWNAVSRAFITPDGPKGESATLPHVPQSIFLSSRANPISDNTVRFSKIERDGREGEILRPLQLVEPRLRRLAVLVTSGAPMVNGDIGIGTLLPLPFMGEGLTKLLSILLATADAPGGTVFVDEIENGFHYSVLVDVWRAIADAARRSDTQIFATTHSWECIKAAHEAFEQSDAYDFRLHRLDRVGDQIEAVAYDQKSLGTSIEMGLEVR